MEQSSSYGQKPLYYGTSKKSPVYYGSSKAPAYYGGSYGRKAPYYYGESAANPDADSLVGTITIGRILRVVSQRWISVLVFLLIGLVAAFAVYRISPTIYQAKSEFTMDMRRPQMSGGIGQMVEPDYGSTYDEIFNTRLSDWRSEGIVTKIIQQYRAGYPASTVTDAELLSALHGSEIELIRNSRLIQISVRSQTPEIAAALANAYAQAIEAFTDEENKLRCDKAVAQIHEQVEKQRRADERIAKALLDFRTANKVDNLRSEREIINLSLQKTTQDILALETDVTAAVEWEKVLQAAQETPEDFGALPTAVPRSSEIGQAYSVWQEKKITLNALLARFTKNHPDVKAVSKELEALKQQFEEVVSRALATAHGNLVAYRNQLEVFRANSARLRNDLASIEQKIVSAEAGLLQLEGEKEVSSALYKDLLQKENEARIQAEQNNEIVRVGRPATVPTKPVLPNPMIIFACGIFVSIGLGLLFVLVLDHLEDTIISLSDIEQRLQLKVLAVLPHVRKTKRQKVARFIEENKYSLFNEAIAGFRNLLDSARYQPVSQVVLINSTAPGEGKTIMSCSLAISSAEAGKKTLLIDCDIRRPRLAKVWDLKLTGETSFSHNMSKRTKMDFAKLVNKCSIENLDIVASLAPDGVNPSSIMGSQIVADFIMWAREHYERIVIDSPPFGIVGDVVTLASLADSIVIMCCPDRTHFKPIQHASRMLTESGANVIGVIVNDVDIAYSSGAFSHTGRSSYGYSKYGSYGYGGYSAYSGYGPYAPRKSKNKKDAASTAADGKAAPEGKVPVQTEPAPGPGVVDEA